MSWKHEWAPRLKMPASLETYLEIVSLAGGLPLVVPDHERTGDSTDSAGPARVAP